MWLGRLDRAEQFGGKSFDGRLRKSEREPVGEPIAEFIAELDDVHPGTEPVLVRQAAVHIHDRPHDHGSGAGAVGSGALRAFPPRWRVRGSGRPSACGRSAYGRGED